MPYYVYRVEENDAGIKKLKHLETFTDYKSARTLARDRRAERASDDPVDYRLIFAKNEVEAEKLLSAPRDERVIGED